MVDNKTLSIIPQLVTPVLLAERVHYLATDYHDLLHASVPLDYTKMLVISRAKVINDLSAAIGKQLRPWVHGKAVLEIGPGAFDLLYILAESRSQPKNWTALDIHSGIVEEIASRYHGIPNYSAIRGTVRKLPFMDNSYDTVVG